MYGWLHWLASRLAVTSPSHEMLLSCFLLLTSLLLSLLSTKIYSTLDPTHHLTLNTPTLDIFPIYSLQLQDSSQVDGLETLGRLARGPPGDDGGTRLLRLLQIEVRLGVTRPAGVLGNDEGAVSEPPVDVVGSEGRGVVGEDYGVSGTSGIVDGKEGALGEVLDGGWGNGPDDDVRDGSGPVRNCLFQDEINVRPHSSAMGDMNETKGETHW